MKCNICNSDKFKVIYNLSNLKIKKCRHCKHVFSDQKYLQFKNKNLYTKNYFKKVHPNFFADCKEDYINKIKKNKKLQNFNKVINIFKNYKKSGRILDLGCATGVFLNMCQKQGFKVCGVEISKYSANYAQKKFKLNVKIGKLENIKFSKKYFDIITMLDFVEHVPDPSKILKEAHKILKDDGLLYLLTINENSLMTKLADLIYKFSFGFLSKPVELLHPIHHIHHFSKKILKEILNKNGFKIIFTKKSEMPIENIEGGLLIKTTARVLYVFSNLFNWQHEIAILAKKNNYLEK